MVSPDPDVDPRLASALVAGDDTALEEAYERWGSLVFTYCARSLGDRALAADVTQETFVAAWRSCGRFDARRGTVPGWLLGIARHKVGDARRQLRRTPPVATIDAADAEDVTDRPASSAAEDRLAERLLVAAALDELADRPRRVLESTFFEQRTQSEVAAHLGLPLGTVKSDLRRGLALLRAHLHGLGEWEAAP